MQRNKHIVAAALVLLVTLPLVAPSLWQIHRWYIKHEMEERLEKAELVELRLPKDSVVWYKQGKEIIVGRGMFDVKSWVIEGKTIRFSGLYDYKESQIKKKLEDFSKKENGSATGRQYRKYISSPSFSQPLPDHSLSAIGKLAGICLPVVHKQLPNKPYINYPSPPPRTTVASVS